MVNWLSGVSAGVNILLTLLLLLVGAAILFAVLFLSQFKHQARFRIKVDGGELILDRKFREYTDKANVRWLHCLKKVAGRSKFELPPVECIRFNEQGKRIVDGLVDDNGTVTWLRLNSKTNILEPFKTEDRLILQTEFERALDRKGKTWKEIIQNAIPVIVLGLVVVVGLIFSGEIMGKYTVVLEKQAQITQTQQKITEKLYQIETHQQIVTGVDLNNPPN